MCKQPAYALAVAAAHHAKDSTWLSGMQVREAPQRSQGPAFPSPQSLSKARQEKDASASAANPLSKLHTKCKTPDLAFSVAGLLTVTVTKPY